jgi:hypothetical protein
MFNWGKGTDIRYEPVSITSKKNPELVISFSDFTFGLEVKAPRFCQKHNERSEKSIQLPARSPLINMYDKKEIMFPRDNPVKDFLISADSKFNGFKRTNSNFFSVLFIVWDDFIYEPISAISSPLSGLFTEHSFAKDEKENILKFNNVDCVIISRHLLQIKNGTRDEELHYGIKHPLWYGETGVFPYKIFFLNPWNKIIIPDKVLDCFQALIPDSRLGAEYIPQDHINWLNI